MSKPVFTGIWKFNRDKSSLQIPPPDATTFVIEHREPHFRLSRSHGIGENTDTFTIEFITDGQEVVRNQGLVEVQARLYWEGEMLVCDSKLSREGVHAVNIVRYSLADEGRTFIAQERFRSDQQTHDNTWVFDKQ